MESITPVSRLLCRKMMLSGGSSSSRCKEAEILGISPSSANGSSVSKPSKQKEIIPSEIIDTEMEDDVRGQDFLSTGVVGDNGKGKETLSNFPSDNSNLATDGSGSDVQMSDHSNVDDSSSNLFYEEDEWLDTYYDDIVFDDYDVLQSHYDSMNIPPGVEMPFPWLPDGPQISAKVPVAAASGSSSSSAQANSNDAKAPSMDLSPSSPTAPKRSLRLKKLAKPLNLRRATRSTRHHFSDMPPNSPLESGFLSKKYTMLSQSLHTTSESPPEGSGSLPPKFMKESFDFIGKSKKRNPPFSYFNSHPTPQFGPAPIFMPPVQNQNGTTKLPSVAMNTVHNITSDYATSTTLPNTPGVPPGYSTVWQDMPMTMFENTSPFAPIEASIFYPTVQASANFQTAELPPRIGLKNLDEILRNFDQFKKFDTVEDCSDHFFFKQGSVPAQSTKLWAKRIQEEWKILENDLPDTIFVRVYESRMDLLRAVIIGAEGTPYHDGLFFFDFYFPIGYPNCPPLVHYHSGGLRINPNLYNCGKVCLSLLNTWSGNHKEKWIPGVSTVLQVLVSIQGLILNAKPFFNEPGYADLLGSESGEEKSLEYNERTFVYSLQTMLYVIRRPPKYFEDFAYGHFSKRSQGILAAAQAYLNGACVGSPVNGGSSEGDDKAKKSCSAYFKSSVSDFIPRLTDVFSRIGKNNGTQSNCLSGPNPAILAPQPQRSASANKPIKLGY
ncbi:probable ubiquitin-conjugating enzyme E2 25 isoform X2 [Andrographis paniculata]|uniref:probable ubiquitin-conjugating enzyme E2 25 isoform X2 n=1 Tax=Andrographis paniculata TaxID=175694 RepID=UPI0021E977BA|nr:probable ubiquitin-conjugating enzyme E2 25 isoform X2 [Andrographis paniculata]